MSTFATPPSPSSSPRLVIGITGASGAVYAVRTIEALATAGAEIHLACSANGRRLLFDELGLGQHISMNRRNGFFAMVQRIRREAERTRPVT